MATALIVDENMEDLLSIAEVFRTKGFSTETAQNLEDARQAILRRMPEVTMINERLGGKDSLELLGQLDLGDVMEIYLMSDSRSLRAATTAMRLGVSDYFDKPIDMRRLALNLDQWQVDSSESLEERTVDKSGRGLLFGESAPMQRLYRIIRKVAPSDATVLLAGESGSGKELVARSLHELSGRAHGEFVAVNCTAVNKELIESELFGHKKGSFTGATRNHRGFFERASGGTLFLDEITEMSTELQAKLLRALESNCVTRVGDEEEIPVDVRVIAATNREPHEAVESGELREDLYYRLAEFPIGIPPLRDRGDDVTLLAEHFLNEQNLASKVAKTFAEDTLETLRLHDWPGNVRELRNAVVHGYLLADTVITVHDLPDGIPTSTPARGERVRLSLGVPLAEIERRYILATLAYFEGDKKKTAETLGISLKTLYNRLKRYGIPGSRS